MLQGKHLLHKARQDQSARGVVNNPAWMTRAEESNRSEAGDVTKSPVSRKADDRAKRRSVCRSSSRSLSPGRDDKRRCHVMKMVDTAVVAMVGTGVMVEYTEATRGATSAMTAVDV